MPERTKILEPVCTDARDVNLDTLHAVLTLAIEIAREGREGKKIGTLFTVSDADNVLRLSKCLILDPLKGHPSKDKMINNPDLRETIKELSLLDGAFIVSDRGEVISACRYIDASAADVKISLGLGSRHMAAASITKCTGCVAVVVSESAIVRVFDDGELISEIIPELWMLSRYSSHLKGTFAEETDEQVTIRSRE